LETSAEVLVIDLIAFYCNKKQDAQKSISLKEEIDLKDYP